MDTHIGSSSFVRVSVNTGQTFENKRPASNRVDQQDDGTSLDHAENHPRAGSTQRGQLPSPAWAKAYAAPDGTSESVMTGPPPSGANVTVVVPASGGSAARYAV